jgi:hypothetical protein
MIFMATGNSVTLFNRQALFYLLLRLFILSLMDTEDIVKSIASGRIRSNRTISKWLKDNSKKSRIYGYGGRTVILPDLGVEQVLTHLGVPIRVKRIE